MLEAALDDKMAVRLAVFLAVLAIMVAWEMAAPRRRLGQPRWLRWYANLGVVVLGAALLRAVPAAAPLAAAAYAAKHGVGALAAFAAPGWLAGLLAVVALDLAVYLQHVVFHAVPALWRLHRMHHADLDFDATTGLRFHPFEIVISAFVKSAAVVVVGAPVAAVLVFEVLLNATSLFNHGNVRMPAALDRLLRLAVVTPDMHRVHHSIKAHETNSNFGFNLPWWDRLFGTYRAEPEDGHAAMTIGLTQFRARRALHLDRLLIQPFQGEAGNYPINRQGAPPPR